MSESTSASSVAGSGLRVEFDALCVLFADMPGMLRVRLVPSGADVIENVTLVVRDKMSGVEWRKTCTLFGTRQLEVPVTPKRAGTALWDVLLEYDADGRHAYEGEWATVVTGRDEARKCAESLVININTNITGGHASEIHNSLDAVGKIKEALSEKSGNVYDTLYAIVIGGNRAYRWIDLYPCRLAEPLPPMPPEASCERLTLDLGIGRVHLFSDRVVTFGRSRDRCDIALRPPQGAFERDEIPYRMVSRLQCHFVHSGSEVVVVDGIRDAAGAVHPSSFGTYLNGVRIVGETRLPPAGGTLSFSGAGGGGVLSLEARVLTPGVHCASCPRSERIACQGGARPSLLLRRTDGISESFVAVWSCVRLEDVDPSRAGVKIFREGNGFAWRRGRRCGWLVPGMTADDLM